MLVSEFDSELRLSSQVGHHGNGGIFGPSAIRVSELRLSSQVGHHGNGGIFGPSAIRVSELRLSSQVGHHGNGGIFGPSACNVGFTHCSGPTTPRIAVNAVARTNANTVAPKANLFASN